MSKLCTPERPNEAGESPVLIRWIVETDNGWIGSWDEAPLAEYCDLKRQLAEARALIQGLSGFLGSCSAAFRERHAAALKAAREQS